MCGLHARQVTLHEYAPLDAWGASSPDDAPICATCGVGDRSPANHASKMRDGHEFATPLGIGNALATARAIHESAAESPTPSPTSPTDTTTALIAKIEANPTDPALALEGLVALDAIEDSLTDTARREYARSSKR